MDFSAERFEEWAGSLLLSDTRLEGMAEYQWNETKTKEEKRIERVNKIKEAKQKARDERQRKADAEARQKRREEWLQRKEEREAR